MAVIIEDPSFIYAKISLGLVGHESVRSHLSASSITFLIQPPEETRGAPQRQRTNQAWELIQKVKDHSLHGRQEH